MRRVLALGVVAVLLAACSSSGGGGTQPYVDAAMKSYDKNSGGIKDTFSRSEAECVVKGMVDAIGADTLKQIGVTPGNFAASSGPFKAVGKKLNAEQANKVVDVLIGGSCFNFTDLAIKQAGSGSAALAGIPKPKLHCLFDAVLAGAGVKKALADSILGKPGADAAASRVFSNQSKILAIMSKCKINPSALSGN